MHPRSLATSLLLSLVSLGLPACASTGTRSTAANSATLEVRNSYIGPIDLYAIRSGVPQRIGSVTGSGPQRFRLGPTLIGSGNGSIRIIAVPLAESGRASTGTITVQPGDVVQFNISPTLAASSVFIR